jgi:hypothetical protein
LAAINREFENKLRIQAESSQDIQKDLRAMCDLIHENLEQRKIKSFVRDDMTQEEVSSKENSEDKSPPLLLAPESPLAPLPLLTRLSSPLAPLTVFKSTLKRGGEGEERKSTFSFRAHFFLKFRISLILKFVPHH